MTKKENELILAKLEEIKEMKRKHKERIAKALKEKGIKI